MRQTTLKRDYQFEGKGLHTGVVTKAVISPAAAGTGIIFYREDLGIPINPVAENVVNTARCSVIANGSESISTIEHIMSALTGLGVDNAEIHVTGPEMPILDGSAAPYSTAIVRDGLAELSVERNYLSVDREIEVKDEATGSWVKISPAGSFSYTATVDFGSRVLGVQQASWDASIDYVNEISRCRTFVFFHEIEYLLAANLIKGGDIDNAIIIVEHQVPQERIDKMSGALGLRHLEVRDGYLSNLELHYPNECGRHKLLDLIGDLRLCGFFLKAKVEAYKPGHGINNLAARALREAYLKK